MEKGYMKIYYMRQRRAFASYSQNRKNFLDFLRTHNKIIIRWYVTERWYVVTTRIESKKYDSEKKGDDTA